jgi:sulfate transport system ATP-binding protein
MSIDVKGITKRFEKHLALDQVDLRVNTGELVALLGPSGSGKTTLLRIIAGLETPDSGEIWFQGQEATQQSTRDRGIGFVFQHYALFRTMTVADNVAFGLRVRPRHLRPPADEIGRRVRELLQLVHLDGLAARYPSQLSGGQRQRVALARALAVEPRVLLLDEPFGALDARVRDDLRRWLRRLHDELHITSVFVTHDQEEALELADRVAVMHQGRIQQIGTPMEVYDHPATPFVYQFLGNVNLFHGRVDGGVMHVGNIHLHAPNDAAAAGSPAVGYVRPHEIHLERQTTNGALPALVRHIRTLGPIVRIELERTDNGEAVQAELTRDRFRELLLEEGESVFVTPRNYRLFADDYSI